MPKNNVFPILKPLLIVPLSQAYQKLPKTVEPPSKVNVEQATAICLKKIPKICEKFRKYFFWKTALADPIFTLDRGFQLLWTAFDMLVTVVPLKEALGWKKLIFGHFKK